MVNMVSAVDHINGSVHFNTAYFCTCQVLFVVNMVNMVVFNDGKHAAQVPDNARLSTVVNVAVSDYVGTNVLFCPTLILRLADTLSFSLCAIFEFPFQVLIVIIWLLVFAQ